MAASIPNPLVRKTALKFLIRRWVGEPYVGKRMKMRHLARLLRDVGLPAAPRILEVGSGDGVFCEWLSRRWPDATVEGLELDPEEAAACAAWAAQTGHARLRFCSGDVLDMEATDAYDLIVCLDVLEHIRSDSEAVGRMRKALKPGGRLIAHVPNLRYQRLDGSIHTVPPEDAHLINPGHVRNGYAPEELRALLDGAGLEVECIRTQHGRLTDLAYTVYRRLERPAPLRLLSLPLIDLIWGLDVLFPGRHGNTVFAVGRKAAT